MPCREWNDEWIARLYGELEPDAERVLAAHLEGCAACRETLAELEATSLALRASATDAPSVGPARVLVLRPAGLRRPAWAFAAGIAAALLVFSSGLFFGLRLPARSAAGASTPTEAADVGGLAARVGALERSLADARTASREVRAPTQRDADAVTSEELGERLDRLENRIRVERARDMEFVLGEISATEWRAGRWIDETRQAVRYVALRNDPRFNER